MPEAAKPQAQPPRHKFEFDKTYTYRLRRHKSGTFNGLWELCKLNKQGGVEKMIDDAQALNFCMDNLQGDLENDGF